MWKPVPLPYKSDSLPLPAIPTAAEIRACTNVLWDGAHRIVALNEDVVVKYDGGLDATEGQNLIYLERYAPKVPAPRLYAMFEEDGKTYLILQRIPGVPLDSIWKSLTVSEKNGITAKLIPVFDAMREAACPWPDFYGGLDGGRVHHWLFYSQKKKDFKFLGPYYGEDAFVAGMLQNFRVSTERCERPDFKARFYEKYLPQVLRGHRPTLTHSDFHQKNILVIENPCPDNQGERSFEVVLIDWEDAGWYPDFWEFFMASDRNVFSFCDEDWFWHMQQFLEVWPAELGVMRLFEKDMRGH
ncbi:uncharacterized protein DSM5745_02621 [Aspergillus mulundensis]|uniref:Aminoglycoside phosphotransferase domain-containing protein n=1 Tax=Aspergillus mulundensis TaxID=1810919 RepID=A0A3D8SX10_9EURO|nr:Uncharacterized protein DSM5745_02621 [Aspergillus mulundensis]RDW90846.1 Uncharacterized protein DSM5745_02621 [Aspergillus mulundensis]